jgi:hypothetical protein
MQGRSPAPRVRRPEKPAAGQGEADAAWLAPDPLKFPSSQLVSPGAYAAAPETAAEFDSPPT